MAQLLAGPRVTHVFGGTKGVGIWAAARPCKGSEVLELTVAKKKWPASHFLLFTFSESLLFYLSSGVMILLAKARRAIYRVRRFGAASVSELRRRDRNGGIGMERRACRFSMRPPRPPRLLRTC